jgi:hypothetical protein
MMEEERMIREEMGLGVMGVKKNTLWRKCWNAVGDLAIGWQASSRAK